MCIHQCNTFLMYTCGKCTTAKKSTCMVPEGWLRVDLSCSTAADAPCCLFELLHAFLALASHDVRPPGTPLPHITHPRRKPIVRQELWQ